MMVITKFKKLYLLFALGILFISCQQSNKRKAQQEGSYTDAVTYEEQYRPQYHFTPAQNWMNDPNGMVYYDGEYHLFYQYNPFGNTWGHMSWGHAVSTDLVHWKHLPVALKEEHNVMIFTGSAVVDKNNTSGFGTKENPPMVAIYTGSHTDKALQDQRIAYSLDKGRSWTKYKGNPVIDEGLKDFRDPKVFWHQASRQWVMVVALPTQHKVRFYGSPDLKHWKQLSEFGPAGATGGVWECPGLFKLPVDGNPDQSQWVLQVDLNPGGPNEGSGSQYFIGDFDGKQFTQDPSNKGETHWSDYGKDFYAVQSFSNIPKQDGRRIWIGWMNNWQYGTQIPTQPWRSAMTIPRSLTLKTFNDGIHLVQQPIEELKKLRGKHHHFEGKAIDGNSELFTNTSIDSKFLEIEAQFKVNNTSTLGLKVAKGNRHETIVGYDVNNKNLYVDRTHSGDVSFSDQFPGLYKAPLEVENGQVTLHIFLDKSSVEVFGNGGRATLTDRIFPTPNSDGISLFAKGGSAGLISLDVWQLNSIWNNSRNKRDYNE